MVPSWSAKSPLGGAAVRGGEWDDAALRFAAGEPALTRSDHESLPLSVEVVFSATGQIRVLKVVRGLGHGLDESAVRAAEKIQFKPALRDGHPADFEAVLHIVFQLAS